VAVGIGVWSATRSSGENAFASVLSRPGARVIKMGSGSGAVAVAPDGEAALALRLPHAPGGKTYEAWIVRPNSIRAAGTFSGGGTSIVRIPGQVPKGSVIAVSIERAGGAKQPTRKPFIASAETT
jgi:hypothetical protein